MVQIGGIYYDFKIRPIEADQSAAMIYNRGENPDDDYPWMLIVKTTGDQAAARKQVEAACKEVFPDRLFEAQYIEEMIEDGFADESRVLNIVLIFTAEGTGAVVHEDGRNRICHRRADCLVHYEPLAFRVRTPH